MGQYGAGPPQPGSRMPGTQIADIFFPINGLDVSISFEWQTPDTTPEGVNVRTFEPSTNRARGGQRWGLSKYIDQMLPLDYTSGSPAIQMLQVVVDPSATALGVSYPPGSGYYNPPLVFIGGFTYLTYQFGSGFPPSAPPNLLVIKANNQTKAAGTKFTFTGKQFSIVQGSLQSGDTINSCIFDSSGAPASAQVGTYVINIMSPSITNNSGTEYVIVFQTGVMTVSSIGFVQSNGGPETSVAFNNNVTNGDLLVIEVEYGQALVTVTNITDSLGNTYTLGGSASSSGVGTTMQWWFCNTNSSGSCTVTATYTGNPGSVTLGVYEFSGVLNANVIASASNLGSSGAFTTGTVSVTALSLLMARNIQQGNWTWTNQPTPIDPSFQGAGLIAWTAFAGPVSVGGTGGSGPWVAMIIEFRGT